MNNPSTTGESRSSARGYFKTNRIRKFKLWDPPESYCKRLRHVHSRGPGVGHAALGSWRVSPCTFPGSGAGSGHGCVRFGRTRNRSGLRKVALDFGTVLVHSSARTDISMASFVGDVTRGFARDVFSSKPEAPKPQASPPTLTGKRY